MIKAETNSRTGEDMSPAARVSAAMAGLIGDFKAMQANIEQKLHNQEERVTMLDRKSATFGRPALSTATEIEVPHVKAFDAYIRSGDDDALRGLELDGKSMSSSVNADGGYLVDPKTSDLIKSTLISTTSIRGIANVVTVDASSYDVLVDQNDLGAGWADETSNTAETGTPTLDRITIPLYELTALPKISQRLLDDSAFDIEAWLAGRVADKFARAEAAAFVNGDGADKPTGFLNQTLTDNDSWTWGTVGYIASGSAAGFSDADKLIELVYAVGAEYRQNAAFVMNSKTAGLVRSFKDGDGRHLWSDGLSQGQPARLLGYPVVISEDMPDVGADTTPIAFGDFQAGYTIAERPDLRILRDPFSAKPHVLFYASKRVGGNVTDFAAFKLLKCAAS